MNKLNAENIIKHFEGKIAFETADIADFYRQTEPQITATTVNWRIHSVIKNGVIQRVGRGKFALGKERKFVPELSEKMKQAGRFIKKEFPFARYCLWDLSMMNSFLQHLINFNVYFVDVERDAVDAVYLAMQEHFPKVMAVQNLYGGLSDFDKYLIVRPLVSQIPIQKNGNFPVATLEKILVDLATDNELTAFQGNEINHVFENAFEKFSVKLNSMLRYAERKDNKEIINGIIKTIKRQ
jgi:hypothetical protein